MTHITSLALPLFALGATAQGPALTIYNQNFAVVRDRVALDLQQGANDAQFAGVTAQLEPDSVVLRDPAGQVQLTILEQNYRADVASQAALLSLHEGKELDFLVFNYQQGTQSIVRGKLIRAGWGGDGQSSPIVEVAGSLRFALPGMPVFPSLGEDTILAPTLDWRLHAETAAKLDAEVSYVTGGLSWLASYNLVAPEKGDEVDFVGWITMDNRSGKTFRDATVKLMAGDVNKVRPANGPPGPMTAAFLGPGGPSGPGPMVTEKAFDEFHLYSLPLATTLRDRQQKQVEFVRATQVKAPSIYVYNGASSAPYSAWNLEQVRSQPNYGPQSNRKVWVMRELMNTKANGLGIPLPAGRTRFYRRDEADNRLEFVGENTIAHTPKDELLRIYTGDAFDLVGERKCTDFKATSPNAVEETFEIRVRNKKDVPVEVRVFERLWRWSNWEVLEKSHEFAKLDAGSIEFRVAVPSNGETVVTYRVRYWWP